MVIVEFHLQFQLLHSIKRSDDKTMSARLVDKTGMDTGLHRRRMSRVWHSLPQLAIIK